MKTLIRFSKHLRTVAMTALLCSLCTLSLQAQDTTKTENPRRPNMQLRMNMVIPDFDALIIPDQEPEPLNLDEVKSAIDSVGEGANGEVVARILVNETGDYMKHRIVKPHSPEVDEVVNTKIAALKFTPAMLQGKSIKYWTNVTFSFGETSEEGAADVEDVENTKDEAPGDSKSFKIEIEEAPQDDETGDDDDDDGDGGTKDKDDDEDAVEDDDE